MNNSSSLYDTAKHVVEAIQWVAAYAEAQQNGRKPFCHKLIPLSFARDVINELLPGPQCVAPPNDKFMLFSFPQS